MNMAKICVIGGCSMDLVVTSNKRPHAGETVLGEQFSTVRAVRVRTKPSALPV